MRVIKIVFMSFLLISLVGCSITNSHTSEIENNEQDEGIKEQYVYRSIDLFNMDRNARINMGIDLNFSPDRKHFFITDTYGSHFRKAYLYENSKKEIEIFDFYEWFGKEALSDGMIEVKLFWGGKSDKIYLHAPFWDTLRLWVYPLKSGKWERVDIPFIKTSNFITSLHNTDILILKEEEKFYLVDVVKQTKEELILPNKASICDQKDSKILFNPHTGYYPYRNEDKYRLGIYDVKVKKIEYLEIPVPVDTSGNINFVPNSENKISYMATLKDEYNRVTSVVVIYDISSGSSIFIPINEGRKNFIGWDHMGKSIYGTNYVITIK